MDEEIIYYKYRLELHKEKPNGEIDWVETLFEDDSLYMVETYIGEHPVAKPLYYNVLSILYNEDGEEIQEIPMGEYWDIG